MKPQLWFGAMGVALVGNTALAQDRFPAEATDDAMLRRRNRFSLKATFNFNVKTEFTSVSVNNSGALVPGVNRSYDDGFVFRDISGNAGGSTWNWGYNDASQFNPADPAAPFAGTRSLAFHSVSSLADGQTRGSRDKMLPGLELAYEEVLGRFHITEKRRANVGILVSFGYMRLGQRDTGSLAGMAGITTDKYATGAVLPPLAPYSGSFAAPGPLLPDVPANRATGFAPATGTVINKLDGSLYGLNLGPFIEFPLHDRVSLTLGGGLGVVYASTRYGYSETIVVAPNPFAPAGLTANRSGRVSADDWLFSATAKANLYVALSEAWSWEIGLAYQYAGNSRSSVQGKSSNLQLDSILTVNTGLNYAF
ncbi:MAG: hypothetical protein RL514_2119 [Verrucomicrobiota bacterium]|jgi:hypothetical protein